MNDSWISVDERLPEIDFNAPEYERYVSAIVSCEAGVMEMKYISNSYAKTEKGRAPRWEWQGKIAPWGPTHWQPLPEPPKE